MLTVVTNIVMKEGSSINEISVVVTIYELGLITVDVTMEPDSLVSFGDDRILE